MKQDIELKVGRSNLALTVFVPWDCPNHCSFCTSKALYKDNDMINEYSIYSIKERIKTILSLGVNEVVITGGEPFSNIKLLQQIIDAVPEGKKIFINTTFPVNSELDKNEKMEFISKNKSKITCLNISRHGIKDNEKHFEKNRILKAENFDKITVPIRINVVRIEDDPIEPVINYWYEVSQLLPNHLRKMFSISIRADYRKITHETLKSLNDVNFQEMASISDLEYLGSGGCAVCNSDNFIYKTHMIVSYHRGMEHSSIIIGNKRFVNDLIIFPDDSFCIDWDKKTENYVKIIEMLIKNYGDLNVEPNNELKDELNSGTKGKSIRKQRSVVSKDTNSKSSGYSKPCGYESRGHCGLGSWNPVAC